TCVRDPRALRGGACRGGATRGPAARTAAKSLPRAPACSFPFEARLALLLERGHALAVIVAKSCLALQIALGIELRVERVTGGGVHRLFQQSITSGRSASQS